MRWHVSQIVFISAIFAVAGRKEEQRRVVRSIFLVALSYIQTSREETAVADENWIYVDLYTGPFESLVVKRYRGKNITRSCSSRLADNLSVMMTSALMIATMIQTASALTFELTIPAQLSSSELLGRAFVFISTDATCAEEPRNMVGDGQDTEQLFGIDVDEQTSTTSTIKLTAADLGYPVANLSSIPDGKYCIQAVFAPYTRYHRKDGHVVDLPSMSANRYEGGNLFGAPGVQYSQPRTQLLAQRAQDAVTLTLSETQPPGPAPVGRQNDTRYIKHVRVQSKTLSEFWGAPMYLEACVLLPAGFDDPAHKNARYPVFVYQGHYHEDWATPVQFSEKPPAPGLEGYDAVQAQFAYWLYQNWTAVHAAGNASSSSPFAEHRARGLIVTLKHPTPYYDDSYAVNSAAQGEFISLPLHFVRILLTI